MKLQLLKPIPLAAAASLVFMVLPLRAEPPVVHSGGAVAHAHSSVSSGGHAGISASGSHVSISSGRSSVGISGSGSRSGGSSVHVASRQDRGNEASSGMRFPVASIPGPTTSSPAFRPHLRPRFFSRLFIDVGSSGSGGTISGYSGQGGSDGSYADSGASVYPDADAATGSSTDDANTASAPSEPTPVPSMGSSIQVALANAGYYGGAINGVIGPGSTWAISRYQRDHRLPVTGMVDMYLLHSLGLYQ